MSRHQYLLYIVFVCNVICSGTTRRSTLTALSPTCSSNKSDTRLCSQLVIECRSAFEELNHNFRCHPIYDKMATSNFSPPIDKADSANVSAETSVKDLQPQGISEQTTNVIVSILGSATILAAAIGTISYIRRRRRRRGNE
ncbi:hypothetical protein BKA58DRAFT_196298 [Alternaria rosae]|uniref:uncharacterized protein n=1 Tax=Alternaria rosae TaxID=1187941 RepID=UPI001E8EA8CE|nr:uncharacterized protein BKA58DRAFT_196298 [Alternaria rosae]KAH6868524.1 hypothetical protein BKA58DRAFT_196298 [Alternaria rosae]